MVNSSISNHNGSWNSNHNGSWSCSCRSSSSLEPIGCAGLGACQTNKYESYRRGKNSVAVCDTCYVKETRDADNKRIVASCESWEINYTSDHSTSHLTQHLRHKHRELYDEFFLIQRKGLHSIQTLLPTWFFFMDLGQQQQLSKKAFFCSLGHSGWLRWVIGLAHFDLLPVRSSWKIKTTISINVLCCSRDIGG